MPYVPFRRMLMYLRCRVVSFLPKPHAVVLGGILVSVLATSPKVLGFRPGRGRWILRGDDSPQHTFLRRGNKVVGPMLKNFTAC
jgi:hypothetical protein